MSPSQSRLTDFFRKYQPKAPPKKILLKLSGTGGLLAEQDADGKINLFVDINGRQKLISILNGTQFKAIDAIPPLELSPNKLKTILPKVAPNDILLLNEALLKLYREKTEKNTSKVSELF